MHTDSSALVLGIFGLLPEGVLILFFVIALLIDATVKGSRRGMGWLALTGFALAGLASVLRIAPDPTGSISLFALGANPFHGDWFFPAERHGAGNGMTVVDDFAVFFKVVIAAAGVLVSLFSIFSRELDTEGRPRLGEYYTLLIGMTVGLFLMASANDLLLAYLAIEIASLSSYAIVGVTKGIERSGEASMKYVIYGGVASGAMLFGISLMYGLIGTTNFMEIAGVLGARNVSSIPAAPFVLSSVMILAGIGYKLSAVPFHAWTPDVYEGGPITMTAYLSVASKAGAFALLARLVVTAYPQLNGFDWGVVLGWVAVATMTIGNLAALGQSNLKRLLAYSSIAHAGYMIAGVALGTRYGVAAMMIYMGIYLVMNLGAFFAVQIMSEQVGSEELEDYKGLGPSMPAVGVVVGILMMALVGIPPTGGFAAKFFLFVAIIDGPRDYLWLAIAVAVNSVIALYYYLRVLKVMYLDKPSVETIKPHFGIVPRLILFSLGGITLVSGLPNVFGPLFESAQGSLGTLIVGLREGAAKAFLGP